jgi:hypothetical protein
MGEPAPDCHACHGTGHCKKEKQSEADAPFKEWPDKNDQ